MAPTTTDRPTTHRTLLFTAHALGQQVALVTEVACEPTPETPARMQGVSRLSVAARLAGMRPAGALRVDNPSHLSTSRLLLRPLRRDDREEFLRVLGISRGHLARFCPLHKAGLGPCTAEETDSDLFERQLEMSDLALATGRAWRRVAFTKDGRLAGSFCINDIVRGLENTGEMVFWISADQAGLGLGTEGIRAAMELAFGDLPRGLGLHRLSGLVAPKNLACLSVIRKCGFVLGPQSVPVELILAGKPAAHDTYVAFAPIASPPANLGGDHQRLRSSLADILRTEAMAQMQAS